ncbi:MAG: substrate-binding domain-containing protein, partial [Geminicoccaceae bacterium]
MLQQIICRGLFAGLAAASAAFVPDQAKAQSIDTLRPELKALYTSSIPVGPSAFDDFKMPAKPWKWCHSESYMGNPWRVSMTNELKRLVEGAVAKGDAVSFELSDSNGDVPQQIAQMRAFIDKGCSVITTIAGSSTGLNDVIEAAFKAGIPVVTTASAVTSPYALNIQHNHNVWGYDMGKGIGEQLGGKGNVLMVEGIPGSPIVEHENAGGYRAFAEYPGLNILGKVSGNWTANVTKNVVLQTLATNPAPIDAVWTTGSETRVIAEAFEEAGRPQPLITGSMSGDALGYWKDHKDSFRYYGGAILPTIAAQ